MDFMWAYLAYIISRYLEKYPDKKSGLPFNELADFIFGKLGKEYKLFLWDGKKHLLSDLLYLEKMKILRIPGSEGVEKPILYGDHVVYWDSILILPVSEEEFFKKLLIKVENFEKLKEIEKVVEKSSKSPTLLSEYNWRIDQALEELS